MSEPKPDALSPEVMREEFINILFAKSGGKLLRHKCAEMVDTILEKQMQFYQAVAQPELTADTTQIMLALTGLAGCTEAVIRSGAAHTSRMNGKEHALWQRNATMLREKVNAILELLA